MITNKRKVKPINDYLKEKGIKQTWLAKNTNTSNGHISNVLSGDRTLRQPLLDKINKALGTSFKL